MTAAEERAEWMVGVAGGVFTVEDVIAEAMRSSVSPLRKITLRQLLLSQPGVGKARVDAILRDLVAVVGEVKRAPKDLNLGWLIHRQAGPARLAAFCEVTTPRASAPPWSGFPYAPRPSAA